MCGTGATTRAVSPAGPTAPGSPEVLREGSNDTVAAAAPRESSPEVDAHWKEKEGEDSDEATDIQAALASAEEEVYMTYTPSPPLASNSNSVEKSKSRTGGGNEELGCAQQ